MNKYLATKIALKRAQQIENMIQEIRNSRLNSETKEKAVELLREEQFNLK